LTKQENVAMMSQLNVKIALAPILAIVLVLLIAGAISSLTPPTHLSNPNPTSNYSPAPAQSAVDSSISPFFFIALAIIVGLIAVLLFFREKGLAKRLGE
jgi:H+/Cl- antiporter ClcA